MRIFTERTKTMKCLRKAVPVILAAIMIMSVLMPYGSVMAQEEQDGYALWVGGIPVTAVFVRYFSVSISGDSEAFIGTDPVKAPAGKEVSIILRDVENYTVKGVTVTGADGSDVEAKTVPS